MPIPDIHGMGVGRVVIAVATGWQLPSSSIVPKGQVQIISVLSQTEPDVHISPLLHLCPTPVKNLKFITH